MKFEQTGIEGMIIDLKRLEEVMDSYYLTRDEHWDYQRITFDRKFVVENVTYYLRLRGTCHTGDIGGSRAEIKLLIPLLGRHYYPHGIAYGDEEIFPKLLIDKCHEILKQLSSSLQQIA